MFEDLRGGERASAFVRARNSNGLDNNSDSRRETPRRLIASMPSLVKFCVVGTCGFAADAAVVYAFRGSLGIYAAACLSYVAAATATWSLNRAWTFRHVSDGSASRQWVRFVAASSVGLAVNRTVCFGMVASSPFCNDNPIVPLAVGCIAGMGFNFELSRRLVFVQAAPAET